MIFLSQNSSINSVTVCGHHHQKQRKKANVTTSSASLTSKHSPLSLYSARWNKSSIWAWVNILTKNQELSGPDSRQKRETLDSGKWSSWNFNMNNKIYTWQQHLRVCVIPHSNGPTLIFWIYFPGSSLAVLSRSLLIHTHTIHTTFYFVAWNFLTCFPILWTLDFSERFLTKWGLGTKCGKMRRKILMAYCFGAKR